MLTTVACGCARRHHKNKVPPCAVPISTTVLDWRFPINLVNETISERACDICNKPPAALKLKSTSSSGVALRGSRKKKKRPPQKNWWRSEERRVGHEWQPPW